MTCHKCGRECDESEICFSIEGEFFLRYAECVECKPMDEQIYFWYFTYDDANGVANNGGFCGTVHEFQRHISLWKLGAFNHRNYHRCPMEKWEPTSPATSSASSPVPSPLLSASSSPSPEPLDIA